MKKNAEHFVYLAVELRRVRQLEAAEQSLRTALAINPTHADAMHLLGLTLHEHGQWDEAVDHLRQASALAPKVAEIHNAYGAVLASRNKTADAIVAFQTALKADPAHQHAAENLSRAYLHQGDLFRAENVARSALGFDPSSERLRRLLITSLSLQGRLIQAVAELEMLVAIDGGSYEICVDTAVLLQAIAKPEQATNTYRRAVSLRPEDPALHSRLLYSLHFDPRETAKSIFDEHLIWSRRHSKLASSAHLNVDRNPTRRLRVGYISADFRDHPVPRFFESIVEARDRSSQEFFFYSDAKREDHETQRLKNVPDVWRATTALSDEQLSQLIRQDRIDILVDATGHMEQNRMLVFARRAAPVQCLYPGYPNTSGLAAMDYFLTDAWKDPPEVERYLTERIERLEPFSMCYRPGDCPEVSDLPATNRGYITFGMMNRLEKLTDPMLALWGRILGAVGKSRLLVLVGRLCRRDVEQMLIPRLQSHGISPSRLDFAQSRPRPEYLRLYHRIDVLLDTAPYNGCSTTCDALWMGVPVISVAGETHVSRVGLSLLNAAGLPELVATDTDRYVSLAIDLARDLPRLQSLRSSLRNRLAQSPLIDPRTIAQEMDAAFRRMWKAFCNGGSK